MITPKYIAGFVSLCASVIILPGIDTILSAVLIFMIGATSVIFNLFFFWSPLRKILYREIKSLFYQDLYRDNDFIDFLIAKRNRQKKHETN